MKINRNKPVAGQTPQKIRDFCRAFQYYSPFSSKGIAHFFGKDITAELRNARLIKGSTELPLPDRFTLTAKGSRWANALLIPRVGRSKAKHMIAAMLARAELINSCPDFLYWVDEIHAFGSYLTDTPDLGDIDLIIHWTRRPLPAGFDDYNGWVREHARRAGKDNFYFYDYGLTEVKQLLRARNPYLSFHNTRQRVRLNSVKRIYSRHQNKNRL